MLPQQTAETPRREQGAVVVSSGGAAAQNNLRNIGLIIGREYKNCVTRRSFIITSVVLMVLVFLIAFIPTIVQLITARTSAPTRIVVVNAAGTIAGLDDAALLAYIRADLNGTDTTSRAPYTVTSQPAGAVDNLQRQVAGGQLDILLVLERAANQQLHFTYETDVSAANDGNQPTIQTLARLLTFLDTAHRLGLSSQETARLAAAPDVLAVHARQSQNGQASSDVVAGYILAYLGNILIYIAVLLYAGMVAQGVAEEKGSRVMEILVNATTPFQLLLGKIVGIGAAGLTQMACVVTVGIGALLLQHPLQAALVGSSQAGLALDITGTSISFLLLLLVYFILGFLLYAALYAAMGALVKRQDEVQNAVAPLTVVLAGGYILNFFGIYAPDAAWMKAISYVPFWSPMAMLVRIGMGAVAWWEIILTLGLLVGAIFVCTRFAARLYRYGVLMYGQRPGLGRLLKLARLS
ncbi:MAG TPA: ABC transporter permease [Ktedonobacteraceae bacterium]|jgi:ABC-2 type transport system permease protein